MTTPEPSYPRSGEEVSPTERGQYVLLSALRAMAPRPMRWTTAQALVEDASGLVPETIRMAINELRQHGLIDAPFVGPVKYRWIRLP